MSASISAFCEDDMGIMRDTGSGEGAGLNVQCNLKGDSESDASPASVE